ncbi:MAG: hypothetical protein ACPG7F_03860 [Aggregatilineales bacterium]
MKRLVLVICLCLFGSIFTYAQTETTVIRGQITYGTGGFNVPENTEVVLRYGNEAEGVSTLQTQTDANNRFQFDDIELNPDYAYVTLAQGSALIFSSEVISGDTLTANSDFSITLYELTEDPFALSIIGVEIAIQPFEVADVGDGLVFEQVITYDNRSDRVYTTGQPVGDGRFISLLLDLPPGALLLEPDDSILQITDSTTLADTRSIFPGEHQIRSVYYLGYSDGAIIDLLLNYPIQGELMISVSPDSLSIVHPDLSVSDDLPGVYRGTVNIPDGSLKYEINGTLTTPESEQTVEATALNPLLPLVIIGIVLVLLVLAGFVFLRGSDEVAMKIDRLQQQLHDLEAMHDAGQINHDVYRRQQQALQAELDELQSNSSDEKH